MRYRPLGRSGLSVSEIVRNAERNAAVSDGHPLTADRLALLAGHRWERNFYS